MIDEVHVAACAFGGGFLANAVPHLVAGIQGRPFQSPFANPPGVGLSSATVNVLWGFLNLAVGYALTVRVGNLDLGSATDVGIAGSVGLAMVLILARAFGRLHGGNAPSAKP